MLFGMAGLFGGLMLQNLLVLLDSPYAFLVTAPVFVLLLRAAYRRGRPFNSAVYLWGCLASGGAGLLLGFGL